VKPLHSNVKLDKALLKDLTELSKEIGLSSSKIIEILISSVLLQKNAIVTIAKNILKNIMTDI